MNQLQIGEYLREIGLPDRVDTLKALLKGPKRQSDLHKIFGISQSKLSRMMNRLEELRLVKRDKDGYFITGLGILLLSVVERLDEILLLEELLSDAIDLIRRLPADLQLGISTILKANAEDDFSKALEKAIEETKRAKSWCKYVCRIVGCNVFRILVKNYLRGVRDKMISTPDTVYDRISQLIDAIRDEKLTNDEIDRIRDRLELRVMNIPLQLGVIDGRIAFFQITKGKTYSPVYISENRDFVRWVNSVFDYLWEKAKPVEIPFELAYSASSRKSSL